VIATNDSGTVLSATKTFLAVTPIGVAINDDEETTQSPSVMLSFTTPLRTAAIRVSNYADFLHARVVPTSTSLTWQLLEPKDPRSTRTVWVQFISPDGTVSQYSDSIDVITNEPEPTPTTTTVPTVTTTTVPTVTPSTTSTTTTVPEVSVASTLSAIQPVVVARSYAPVRSATVVPRQRQSSIKKIETKIGKKISTRTVVAMKSGKYVIVFPKGIKTMSVRFVSKSGVVSAWSRIAAP
jgi:hypothetical protein